MLAAINGAIGLEVNPRDGVNPMLQALDYRHREVRDYMLLMIRELVEDHDFEGLELDRPRP